MPNRPYYPIDPRLPPWLWADWNQVVRFLEHLRRHLHQIIPTLPDGCEADLLAAGTAHNPGPVPLLGLFTPDADIDRLPDPFDMLQTIQAWCDALPEHELRAIVATTDAPTWDDLLKRGVHPPRPEHA